MQVSIETTTGLERRLTVGIPAEVVDNEVEKRLKDAAKTVRINGFRKGKVPMKIVKQRFGAGVRQEVLGDTIQRSFYDAVRQESVRPAGQPQIEPQQMEEGKDIEFIATFEVYPEIELKGIDELEITRYDADIDDSDVDKMVESLQKNQATWDTVERAAKDGDQVTIDFSGTIDGEAFDGGSAEGHSLTLGSGSMIPGFEDGIVGMKAGETKVVEATFPSEYHVEKLRDAKAAFEITLHEVKEQTLPELNDEFFSKFGVAEGGEEKFRAEVMENMEREKQRAIKAKLKEQVMDGLLKANPVELPAALVENEINALRQQTMQQYGQAAANLDLKALLPDEMFKERAEKRTALALIVSEFVKDKDLKADKALVRSLIEETASTYEDPEQVINYYYSNDQLLASVEAAALEEQVVHLIIDSANVADKKVSYDDVIKPLENS